SMFLVDCPVRAFLRCFYQCPCFIVNSSIGIFLAAPELLRAPNTHGYKSLNTALILRHGRQCSLMGSLCRNPGLFGSGCFGLTTGGFFPCFNTISDTLISRHNTFSVGFQYWCGIFADVIMYGNCQILVRIITGTYPDPAEWQQI